MIISPFEMFANYSTSWFIEKISRNKGIAYLQLLSGTLLVVFFCFDSDTTGVFNVLEIILALLSRMINVFVFNVINVYMNELYPTPVRNMLLGYGLAFG